MCVVGEGKGGWSLLTVNGGCTRILVHPQGKLGSYFHLKKSLSLEKNWKPFFASHVLYYSTRYRVQTGTSTKANVNDVYYVILYIITWYINKEELLSHR